MVDSRMPFLRQDVHISFEVVVVVCALSCSMTLQSHEVLRLQLRAYLSVCCSSVQGIVAVVTLTQTQYTY